MAHDEKHGECPKVDAASSTQATRAVGRGAAAATRPTRASRARRRRRRSPSTARRAASSTLVDDLHERRAKIKLGGGAEKIAAQHAKGKLTARERDRPAGRPRHLRRDRHARPPALLAALDGGPGGAGGRRDHRLGRGRRPPLRVVAYDFTVMAGSMGMTGEIKVARLREMALQKRMPFIWLLDSAGRAHPGGGRLAVRRLGPPVPRGGDHVRRASRWSPACSAPARRAPPTSRASPTSCRWSRARARWRLPGPHLVKAVTGEDVTQEELGGAKIHCRKSGVGDLEVADDRECIEAIKTYLSYFPSNCEQQPPIRADDGPGRPHGRGAARHRARSRRATRTTCTR